MFIFTHEHGCRTGFGKWFLSKMIKLLFCLLLITPCIWSQEFVELPNSSKLAILTPDLSQREVAKIRLENGVEAYLISDPNVLVSAAAVAVGAGTWDNPKEHQ